VSPLASVNTHIRFSWSKSLEKFKHLDLKHRLLCLFAKYVVTAEQKSAEQLYEELALSKIAAKQLY